MHRPSLRQPLILLFSALFLISGFAGLIYQVVWERLLQLYFGANLLSVTLIVAAYMLGLGLGSLIGGRLSQVIRRPLLVYGLLEGAICLVGLVSPTFLVWLGAQTAGSPLPMVFLLSFACLLLPTVLMGATLPILSQGFITRVENSGQIVALLYGINTLGAAFGALISGFFLVGRLGLDRTVYLACGLNALVCVLALISPAIYRGELPGPSSPGDPQTGEPQRWGIRLAVFAAFLIGFFHLGMEMLWFRVLSITNKSTAYLFPVLLFLFLVGLAVGGFAIGRVVDRHPNRIALFVKIELLVGLASVGSFLALYLLLSWPEFAGWFSAGFDNVKQPTHPFTGTGLEAVFNFPLAFQSLLRYLLIPTLLVLPASVLMGCGIPILDRIAINQQRTAGKRIGDIYLANILGSVCGAVIVPLVLLDRFGTERTIQLLIAVSLLFPLLYLVSSRSRSLPNLKNQTRMAALTLGVMLPVLLLPDGKWLYSKIIGTGMQSSANYQETRDALLSLTTSNYSTLLINGEPHSLFPSPMQYEADAILCAGASRPKKVLVIGLGGGHTASAVVQIPGVEKITIVELLGGLRPFLERNLDHVAPVLSDPKVHFLVDDGRRYLYAQPHERYDMIIIDPQWTSSAGSNNLYSADALRLYQKHLAPEGVLCAWTNEFSLMPKTFSSVFPFVDRVRTELVAKNTPIRYDLEFMRRHQQNFLQSANRFTSGNGEEILAPETILKRFVWDHTAVNRSDSPVPILTDFTPYLEYYYFRPPEPLVVQADRWEQVNDFVQRLDNCDSACREMIRGLALE